MSAAVLSIGSNIGDRLAYLRGCVAMLGDCVRAASPVYSTVPWGVAESGATEGGIEQDDFLNAVLLVDDPDADALEWLCRGQRCEAAAGRTREIRWGPRTLDVDVIDVQRSDPAEAHPAEAHPAEAHRDDPHLTLPHPRAHQRAFVLVPWLDVAPSAVLRGHGPVAELVAALPVAQLRGLRRRDDLAVRSSVRLWWVP